MCTGEGKDPRSGSKNNLLLILNRPSFWSTTRKPKFSKQIRLFPVADQSAPLSARPITATNIIPSIMGGILVSGGGEAYLTSSGKQGYILCRNFLVLGLYPLPD